MKFGSSTWCHFLEIDYAIMIIRSLLYTRQFINKDQLVSELSQQTITDQLISELPQQVINDDYPVFE